MEDRIKMVMAAVFGIEAKEITDTSSADNVPSWDSIHHMSLIVALEEEFSVTFDDEQIDQLLNFKLIALTLKELGK